MKLSVFGVTVMVLLMTSYQMASEDSNILVYPLEASSRIQKWDTSKRNKFLEDKLIEYGQALEHLGKLAQKNEELMTQLVEYLSKIIEKSKLPDKIKVFEYTRRNNDNDENIDDDNIIFRFGKKLPKYGELFRNVLMKHFEDRTDPIPFVEKDEIDQ